MKQQSLRVACCQTYIKSYYHRKKTKQRCVQEPCHNQDRTLGGKITWLASEKEQKNLTETLATAKN